MEVRGGRSTQGTKKADVQIYVERFEKSHRTREFNEVEKKKKKKTLGESVGKKKW